MPVKRNNEVKEFAVGTKIEYNGKLYEVTESNSCVDCSIASVCSSSNKSINITGNLLREERIKIFGECSSGKRTDGKSVVFVEIPKDDSKDNYNFPLNTRRGFKTIYYLMKLSNHDMTTVIKDIIAVRNAGINFITNICDKIEKEDDYILQYLLRGGYIG